MANTEGQKPDRPRSTRFGAYLEPEQVRWINETRGRFLLETGREVRTTNVIRAAIDQLRKLEWSELEALYEGYVSRRDF